MGFKTWSDYRTDGRMAKNAKTVHEFLEGLRSKLSVRLEKDLAKLLAYKKEVEPNAADLKPWDLSYLAYQVKKRDYELDNETIRQYFPAGTVINGMFEVYARLFGVKFVEVKDAVTWAPNVQLYEVRENTGRGKGEVLCYFYTDFFPREGKYGHAAAFSLIMGRDLPSGQYSKPVSAIVANFTPPNGDKPSLLEHDEVETIFHEFGHIMHQTLTRAPYASLAGTDVARDFVEAPSQMLEEWVWDPKILKMISGHYQDPSKKLPDSLIKKMLAARDFNRGYFYTRQLFFGIMDQSFHTAQGSVTVDQVHDQVYKQVVTLDPQPDTHFVAGFGHLMGGYDAGYYGYLWSEVYAIDMAQRFQKGGMLNPKIGLEYRKHILEQGNMHDGGELLRRFLKRKPSSKAFFERLGIKG